MSIDMETTDNFAGILDSEKNKPLSSFVSFHLIQTRTPDSIYRLNRCNAILEELKEEKRNYESTYK
jgi:hypothetical protein